MGLKHEKGQPSPQGQSQGPETSELRTPSSPLLLSLCLWTHGLYLPADLSASLSTDAPQIQPL